MRGLLLLGLVAVILTGLWVFTRRSPSDAIVPDPAIQSAIARAAAATNEAELQAALTRLRELDGADFSALIPQLVLYLMNTTDVHEAMIPGVIIDRLQIAPAQIADALAPYRDTSDPRLKEQIDNLLGSSSGDN